MNALYFLVLIVLIAAVLRTARLDWKTIPKILRKFRRLESFVEGADNVNKLIGVILLLFAALSTGFFGGNLHSKSDLLEKVPSWVFQFLAAIFFALVLNSAISGSDQFKSERSDERINRKKYRARSLEENESGQKSEFIANESCRSKIGRY
ncbi:hypothetical protein [Oricola sp.]|uniref:hypothetical protein n=1 Tax=Oricola sp. TaxID=1979950 RepID=UPI0025EC4E6D|nr:hypothetical protein [Oricola sp.]MCI5076852.1 hypothetical protein [Oricola sp.]